MGCTVTDKGLTSVESGTRSEKKLLELIQQDMTIRVYLLHLGRLPGGAIFDM